ncbi:metallophosphoesterase [Croceibacterium ferulae]|uniref:metallophosphoesterase n=1 Tax=Croceibacterium ferulae TaxID=1854641 RepID=UPI0013902519
MRLFGRTLKFPAVRPQQETRVTVISDTHLRHQELRLAKGDLLIHCGDLFDLNRSEPSDLAKVDRWFGKQPFDMIVCIGGNHDHLLDHASASDPRPFRNARYLQDEALHYRGLQIYGAPWVPGLPLMRFTRIAWL